jgi:hypothetical protein
LTLSQALNLANRRGFATADFNLEDHARYNALPQFLRDVRNVIGATPYWMWKTVWYTFTPGQLLYDLPFDFSRFMDLRPAYAGYWGLPMTYIGERTDKVLSAEMGADAAGLYPQNPTPPGAYYLVHKSQIGTFGPMLPNDYGYVYGTDTVWPPKLTITPVYGDDVLVFATFKSSAFTYSSGILRFDTSTLPPEGAITDAKLHLNVSDYVFDMDNKMLLVEWYDSGAVIDAGDYTTTPVNGAWSGPLSGIVQGMNTLALNDTTRINRSGYTGFRLQLTGGAPAATNSIRIVTKLGPFAPEFGPEFDKTAIINTSLEIDYVSPIVRPFQLKLSNPVDKDYPAIGMYNWQIPVDAIDPELNAWMPPEVQGLFVQRMRCDILMDAFGQGDERYVSEKQDYQANLETLLPHSEAAPKTRRVFVR